MTLGAEDPRGGHLHRAENCNHLEHSVVETWRQEALIALGAAPEVGSAHETWNVEHHYALQVRQRDSLAVAFQRQPLLQFSTRTLQRLARTQNAIPKLTHTKYDLN